jgi:hypothetical protein
MIIPSNLLPFGSYMGLRVRPGNKATVFSAEEPNISSPEDGRTNSFLCSALPDCFLDIRGTVRYEFAPKGETVTQSLNSDVLRRLREGVQQKRPEKWRLEIGFSTMTVFPLTLLCLCRNLWPKRARLSFCTFLTTQTRYGPTFLSQKFWCILSSFVTLLGTSLAASSARRLQLRKCVCHLSCYDLFINQ